MAGTRTSSTASPPSTRAPGWPCNSTATSTPTPSVTSGADAAEAERYLVEQLRGHVADVVAVPVYRWALPLDHAPAVALMRRVAQREVDAVTFTSSPAVVGLARIAAAEDLLDDIRAAFADGVLAASIGEVCSATLRRHGIAPALEPERPRLGALLVATAAALGSPDPSGSPGGWPSGGSAPTPSELTRMTGVQPGIVDAGAIT